MYVPVVYMARAVMIIRALSHLVNGGSFDQTHQSVYSTKIAPFVERKISSMQVSGFPRL
jgi:hypothetical protein